MKINKVTQFSLGFIGILLLLILPVFTPIYSPSALTVAMTASQAEILQQLVTAQVIYLGETHDQEADHQAQLMIIEKLYEHQPQLAIGLEMFQRPFQQFLDQYVAGELTESELKKQTEYQQRWGFPWKYYAQILQFAQAKHLKLLALNTPAEITRKVARHGLESLTPSEWQYLPPQDEIRTDNLSYRQLLFQVYQQHHQTAEISSPNFERFFLAQVLWDETMADAIVKFIRENPDQRVVVLAGNGHISYGYGIPERVQRRLPNVMQRSVIFQSPNQSLIFGEASLDKPIADYIWQH